MTLASMVSPPADWTPYPATHTVDIDLRWLDELLYGATTYSDPTGDRAVRRAEGRPHKPMRGRR